tara:strand:+ start:323 stop:586 length:264 start_codon:yes stop_codon:yes gene_type:complete
MFDRKNPRVEAKKITLEAQKPKFKGHAVYQFEFEKLVSIRPVARDHNFYQKWKTLCEEIKKDSPELLTSLKVKFQDLIDIKMNNEII